MAAAPDSRDRRREQPGPRPVIATRELEIFEREYTIERFSQRDLMLDLGAILWFVTMGAALAAGQLDPAPDSSFQAVMRIVIAASSATIAILLLTAVRKLDDERTIQTLSGLAILALCFQYILGTFGPGSLGGFYVAEIAIVIYATQFLGSRMMLVLLVMVTFLSFLGVQQNYDDPEARHILSNTVMLVIVYWAIGYAGYLINRDRVAALAEAERAAFSDPLTGLPNTRMLRRRATAQLDARNERIHHRTGIVVLDLDGFRAANMLHGRRDGDRLLRAVANAARDVAEGEQLVARTGSDEFSVLVTDTSRHELAALGERYREAVLDAIDREAERGIGIDASVGVAISGEDGDTFDALMRSADQSMYMVKAAHERGEAPQRRRRSGEPQPHDWSPAIGSARARPRRWDRLRWANKSTQMRFVSLGWLISAVGVGIALAMPDAVEVSVLKTEILIVFGLCMATFNYVRRPAGSTMQKFVDVMVASIALSLTISVTGKSASTAWPIALLILIYIGWFMPLKLVAPVSAIAIVTILLSLINEPATHVSTLDAVTILGGTVIAVALMVILYYNHYYLERARNLTAQLASLDPRAGTFNRRAFEERMRYELDQLSYADRDALAVVMVDLGNFKSVSANYGRTIGDRMLSEVAAALIAASRDEDCVARLGGDEFAIVAPGVDAESARALAERLVEAVRDQLEHSDLPSNEQVRPSAGFALYGMHGRTTDELVTAADVALTAAKTSGRDPNRVSSFVVSL